MLPAEHASNCGTAALQQQPGRDTCEHDHSQVKWSDLHSICCNPHAVIQMVVAEGLAAAFHLRWAGQGRRLVAGGCLPTCLQECQHVLVWLEAKQEGGVRGHVLTSSSMEASSCSCFFLRNEATSSCSSLQGSKTKKRLRWFIAGGLGTTLWDLHAEHSAANRWCRGRALGCMHSRTRCDAGCEAERSGAGPDLEGARLAG